MPVEVRFQKLLYRRGCGESAYPRATEDGKPGKRHMSLLWQEEVVPRLTAMRPAASTVKATAQALLAVCPIGGVVAAGVVAHNLHRLLSIQALRFQRHDDQAEKLRKGEGRSFFLT